MARTARTQRLTALAVRKYAGDHSAIAPLHDGGGLYLRKRGASLRWVLRLSDPADGSQQWHRLFPDDPSGAYPQKSLADARLEARRLWATRSRGVDPRAERRREIQARQSAEAVKRVADERRISVRALFERWVAIDLVPRVLTDGSRVGRKDSGAFTRAQFQRRVFTRLGDTAAEDVTRSDLLDVLDAVKAEGKLRTANVLLSDLKQMFRFALARDIVQRNALDTVRKRDVGGKSVERDRVLSMDELRLLDARLSSSGLQARFVCAVWLVLSTGARVGEMLGAVWADARHEESELQGIAVIANVKLGFVDLSARTWYIPQTKNERDHTIHLSDFAVEIFRRLAPLRQARASTDEATAWIYPNITGEGPVGVRTLGKQLSDRQCDPSLRLAGRSTSTDGLRLPGGRWTAHDLRRTCATLMASLGISGDVIDECLNHMIESRVRRTYIRNRRLPEQARAFDAVGQCLATLLKVGKSDPPLPSSLENRGGSLSRRLNQQPLQPSDRHTSTDCPPW